MQSPSQRQPQIPLNNKLKLDNSNIQIAKINLPYNSVKKNIITAKKLQRLLNPYWPQLKSIEQKRNEQHSSGYRITKTQINLKH